MLQEIVPWCRAQFPALRRSVQDKPAVFLDGPAGTQVPQTVIDAIGGYLRECNANHGGRFVTSQLTDEWMDRAHAAVADFRKKGGKQAQAGGPESGGGAGL